MLVFSLMRVTLTAGHIKPGSAGTLVTRWAIDQSITLGLFITLSIPSCIDFHCGCKNTLQLHTQTHDSCGITHALTENDKKQTNKEKKQCASALSHTMIDVLCNYKQIFRHLHELINDGRSDSIAVRAICLGLF